MDDGWLKLGIGIWILAALYAIFIREIIGFTGWLVAGFISFRIGLGLNTLENPCGYSGKGSHKMIRKCDVCGEPLSEFRCRHIRRVYLRCENGHTELRRQYEKRMIGA